jgi:hypothetical protein
MGSDAKKNIRGNGQELQLFRSSSEGNGHHLGK